MVSEAYVDSLYRSVSGAELRRRGLSGDRSGVHQYRQGVGAESAVRGVLGDVLAERVGVGAAWSIECFGTCNRECAEPPAESSGGAARRERLCGAAGRTVHGLGARAGPARLDVAVVGLGALVPAIRASGGVARRALREAVPEQLHAQRCTRSRWCSRRCPAAAEGPLGVRDAARVRRGLGAVDDRDGVARR